MMRSDISCVMQTIISNLMPLCEKDANPELWMIYDEMQKWALLMEQKTPTNENAPAKAAKTIRKHLARLRNRNLAGAIEHVISRHSPVFRPRVS